jgi:Rod binding domain-containing protein
MNLTIGSNIGTPHTSGTQAPQHSRKLQERAVEFESMLLSQCLEKVQESFVGMGDDENGDPGKSTLSGMATTALAQGLAQRGGLGIARMLLQHLPSDIDQSVTPVAPREVNPDHRLPISSVGSGIGKHD